MEESYFPKREGRIREFQKKRKKKERRNASDSIFFLRALFPKISPLGEESRRTVRPSLRRIFDAPSRHRSCEIPRGGKGTSAKGFRIDDRRMDPRSRHATCRVIEQVLRQTRIASLSCSSTLEGRSRRYFLPVIFLAQ